MLLSLTQRVMALIFIGITTVGISVGLLIENEHHQTILQQNKMQAVTFLYGVERNLDHEKDMTKEEIETVLNQATEHRQDELEFSVFSLSVLDADGKIIAKSGTDTSAPIHSREKSDAISSDMAGHHAKTLQSGENKIAGGELRYFHDPVTNKQIATMTVSIVLQNSGTTKKQILSAELDLNKTMASIERSDSIFERTLLISFGVGFLILYVLIDVAVRRSLIRPIRNITKVTSDISQGNFSNRIGNLCCPELQHLGSSIDTMAENIEGLISEQETAYLQSLKSLTKALEAKDPYTAKHSGRVAKFSVLLGKTIGLSSDELKLLEKGALMHDLGKIGVPDHVLNKPSSLTEEEFEQMKSHPMTTAKIMKPLTRFKEFAQIAAWHHERWDGRGYPDGLKGEDIPLLARIVCIADTWDAMTGDRVYRKGMSLNVALNILEKEKDSGQWDPVLVRNFISLITKTEDIKLQNDQRLSA